MKESFEGNSWIQKVSYDPEMGILVIQLKGSTNVYECINVPKEVYEAFRDAPSKGEYFNKNIKGKKDYIGSKWFI